MHKLCFDDGLRLKSVMNGVWGFFLQFFPHFKVFINIHEYRKNKYNHVIFIAGHGITGTCLTFKIGAKISSL